MIKYENTQNGYIITPDSTNLEFRTIAENYTPFKCIICNAKTSACFRASFLSYKPCLTINNKIPDNVFYFNKIM